MKNLLWGIIIAMVIVLFIELEYIGDTSLAFVVMVMAASIGTLAYIQLTKIDK